MDLTTTLPVHGVRLTVAHFRLFDLALWQKLPTSTRSVDPQWMGIVEEVGERTCMCETKSWNNSDLHVDRYVCFGSDTGLAALLQPTLMARTAAMYSCACVQGPGGERM